MKKYIPTILVCSAIILVIAAGGLTYYNRKNAISRKAAQNERIQQDDFHIKGRLATQSFSGTVDKIDEASITIKNSDGSTTKISTTMATNYVKETSVSKEVIMKVGNRVAVSYEIDEKAVLQAKTIGIEELGNGKQLGNKPPSMGGLGSTLVGEILSMTDSEVKIKDNSPRNQGETSIKITSDTKYVSQVEVKRDQLSVGVSVNISGVAVTDTVTALEVTIL